MCRTGTYTSPTKSCRVWLGLFGFLAIRGGRGGGGGIWGVFWGPFLDLIFDHILGFFFDHIFDVFFDPILGVVFYG